MSRILVPSVLTVAILAASAAHADTSVLNINTAAALPVLVVTASKTPEAIEKVPARISVIDEQTIQQSAVTDLPHLLQREAALNIVQSGGYGQQTSIFTRGTNSNHTLLLEDGVRLNTGSQAIPNTQFIDTTLISQIEVLKGPASVQYGSDAVGGVIQLLSQAPTTQKFFSTVEGGELNTYKAIVGADLVQNDAYVQVRGQRLETAGAPVKDKLNAKNADYDQKGYSIKTGIDNAQYAISAEIKENKGTNSYDLFSALTSQDFVNRLLNLKGRYNFNDDLKLNVRYSQFEDKVTQNDVTNLFDYLPPNFDPVFIGSEIDYSKTKTKEADINLQWNFAQQQNLLMGVNRRSTDINSLSSGTQYDKSLDTVGYYLQHQYQDGQFSTQAGVRLEDNEQFGTHTVGQLSMRYFLASETSLYSNIGSAFKAPTGDDLYGYGGNINLKPEKSVSYELGIDHQFNQNFLGYFSVYRTNIKNLIDIDYIQNLNININKSELTGGEAGIKFKKDAWFVNAEYAYIQPKNAEKDEDLSRRPRQTATMTLGWDNNIYGISSSLVAKNHYDNSSYDNLKISGRLTADINAYYQVNPNARLFANVRNLGDLSYRTAYGSGSYYIAAPRLATAGITLSY